MSLSKDDRDMLINLLNQLSGSRLHEVGAIGRTISTYVKQRDLKWDDILVPEGPAIELLVNDSNEEQCLKECAKHIGSGRLTDWEENFIPSNIEKFKTYGYLTKPQRKRLHEIVSKLQRLGVAELVQ